MPFIGILPLSMLTSSATDANAECLDVQPPIWITRQKYYFNIYPSWGEVDDHVTISGLVKLDVINEGRYENRVLIEIQDDNGTKVKSDYAGLNVTDGSFVYNFPLWINNTRPPDPNYFPYNLYMVKATYGLYQADWRFVLTPGQPSGIDLMRLTNPKVTANITVGQQVEISTEIRNNAEIPLKGWPFVTGLIIQDKNYDDVYIAFQSGFLISGCSTQVGFSWSPETEGRYTVKVFAIDDWNDPDVLSEVSSTVVTVTD